MFIFGKVSGMVFIFCCVLNGGLPRISKKTIMFSSKRMALGISHFKKRPCVVLAISVGLFFSPSAWPRTLSPGLGQFDGIGGLQRERVEKERCLV